MRINRKTVCRHARLVQNVCLLFNSRRFAPSDADSHPRVRSTEGVRQGDALGPALFAIAYHPALVQVQAEFPDCAVLEYLDDTYLLGPPARAWAATERLHVLARDMCGLEPNMKKIEVYSPSADADLSSVPA